MDAVVVAQVLAEKRAALEDELRALEAPPDATGAISFGKRVGDGTSMAVERYANVSVHERFLAVLADVRRAEAKLEEGTYGTCDRCGAAIGEARLTARPSAVYCVTCAASP